MLTVLAFVVTIIIIVAFHEWGHFLAMRAFGVRVLTFSVGFGPKLLHFTDKKGTPVDHQRGTAGWLCETSRCPGKRGSRGAPR